MTKYTSEYVELEIKNAVLIERVDNLSKMLEVALPEVDKLRKGLEWALKAGGWRLWYYAVEPPDIIVTGQVGSPATIKGT